MGIYKHALTAFWRGKRRLFEIKVSSVSDQTLLLFWRGKLVLVFNKLNLYLVLIILFVYCTIDNDETQTDYFLD